MENDRHHLRKHPEPSHTQGIPLWIALPLIIFIFLASWSITQMRLNDQLPPPPSIKQSAPKEVRENTASTVLSFAVLPIQMNANAINTVIPLDILLDPGTNNVSFVKLEILYDPKMLAPTTTQTFQIDNSFPAILEEPLYTPGKITMTLSVGPDPTKAVHAPTKIGTLNFKALNRTPINNPTLVSFGDKTQVLSIASQDSASANVLLRGIPAKLIIRGN